MLAVIAKQDSIIAAGDMALQECEEQTKQADALIAKFKEQIANKEDTEMLLTFKHDLIEKDKEALIKENKKLTRKVTMWKRLTVAIPAVGLAVITYLIIAK